jgi:hypothetical protein
VQPAVEHGGDGAGVTEGVERSLSCIVTQP